MLLWEALTLPRDGHGSAARTAVEPLAVQRLPYDKRCATITKSGKRCRGRIHNGGQHCPLHDPIVAERRRSQPVRRISPARRRLSHLPDGYLRKLSSRAAVGQAMDRLYRELRLGIVSIEMGEVLFGILTRLLDSGLVESGKVSGRSRADKVRPKLVELLTRRERLAWRRAVAAAPPAVLRAHDPERSVPAIAPRTKLAEPDSADQVDKLTVALQAAS